VTGIGDTLRRARVQRGQNRAACSAATGIGPAFLHALEEERFDDLPPTAHAPDLVERYAAYLGLDPKRLSDEVRALVSDDPDADTQPIPIIRPPARRDSTLAWVSGGAVIGIGALVLLGGGLGSDNRRPRTVTTTTPTTGSPTQTSSAGATTQTSGVEPPPTLRPIAPTTAAIELRLGAKAGKTVWVEVRRGDVGGTQVFAGIVGGGKTRVIRSAKPLWLGVAWAPNIAVTLNGEVIDAQGGTESYRVTPRGLKKLGGSSGRTRK
jgi:cytoskeletal protein RodZ